MEQKIEIQVEICPTSQAVGPSILSILRDTMHRLTHKKHMIIKKTSAFYNYLIKPQQQYRVESWELAHIAQYILL
jgi:hypothetical protein